MAARFYLRDSQSAEVVLGPLTADQLEQMAREGRVQSTHELSLDRQRWVAATKVALTELHDGVPDRLLAGALDAPLQPSSEIEVDRAMEGSMESEPDARVSIVLRCPDCGGDLPEVARWVKFSCRHCGKVVSAASATDRKIPEKEPSGRDRAPVESNIEQAIAPAALAADDAATYALVPKEPIVAPTPNFLDSDTAAAADDGGNSMMLSVMARVPSHIKQMATPTSLAPEASSGNGSVVLESFRLMGSDSAPVAECRLEIRGARVCVDVAAGGQGQSNEATQWHRVASVVLPQREVVVADERYRFREQFGSVFARSFRGTARVLVFACLILVTTLMLVARRQFPGLFAIDLLVGRIFLFLLCLTIVPPVAAAISIVVSLLMHSLMGTSCCLAEIRDAHGYPFAFGVLEKDRDRAFGQLKSAGWQIRTGRSSDHETAG